jgi:hypothetical protein
MGIARDVKNSAGPELPILDMVALDLPKPSKIKSPMLVLAVARDNMLQPSQIEATARAYRAQSRDHP